jgi:hypothetical protein
VRDKGQAGLILEEGRMGASMRGGVEIARQPALPREEL